MITTAVHHCGAPLFFVCGLLRGGVGGAARVRCNAPVGGERGLSSGPAAATYCSKAPDQPNVAGGVALFPGSSDNICDFERMSLSVSLLLSI